NKVNNLVLVQTRYTRRNVYDNFAALTNRVPEKKYIVAFPPDYLTLTYSCVIFTDFVEQMDKLVEAINFASDSYWGDPSKFQFRAKIDTYSTQTALEIGQDRAIKSTFNIVLSGYVIPDTLNREVASVNRLFSTTQVVFGLETAESAEVFTANLNKPTRKTIAAIAANDSVNVTINQTTSNVAPSTLTYINTNKQLTGTVTNSTTVTFGSGWLVAPTGLPTTSVDNFTFFCNGQFIEKTAIISFTEFNSVSTLVIDPTQLSYSLEVDDEVIAIGKFA
ncbi:MAG: hypothetical protein EBU90_31605, partial [Proteobacteria bacterium]|nr:hypothetical protein [Pseudomonadota bacterium]